MGTDGGWGGGVVPLGLWLDGGDGFFDPSLADWLFRNLMWRPLRAWIDGNVGGGKNNGGRGDFLLVFGLISLALFDVEIV